MSISSCLYYLSVCLTLCLCISCQEANEERPDSFFLSKRYNGDYATTLDLLKPDSVMRHIRDEVPPKWYGLACESAYYHIPEGTSDSIILRHLDLYEQWFPHDTVSVFSKTLRGKTLLRQNRYDTAIACLNEAYLLSVKTHSPFRMGDVTFAMGEFYTRQGNYPEAIKKLLVAYNHYLELPVSKNQSVLFETMLEPTPRPRGTRGLRRRSEFARPDRDTLGEQIPRRSSGR